MIYGGSHKAGWFWFPIERYLRSTLNFKSHLLMSLCARTWVLQHTQGRRKIIFRSYFCPSILGLGWNWGHPTCIATALIHQAILPAPEIIRFKRESSLHHSEGPGPVAFGLWLMESIAMAEMEKWWDGLLYFSSQAFSQRQGPGSEGLQRLPIL